jgi:hypothetical protein
MDAPLIQLLTIGALLFLVARFGLHSFEQAEAGFASLFVPPNRTLPWPRGVQESDSPWAWRPGSPVDDGTASEVELPAVDLDALVAGAGSGTPGHSHYVEPPHQVEPIHVRTLPQ